MPKLRKILIETTLTQLKRWFSFMPCAYFIPN